MKHLRRIECFLALVWRYPTGPSRDETAEECHSKCQRIDIRLAWEIACSLIP